MASVLEQVRRILFNLKIKQRFLMFLSGFISMIFPKDQELAVFTTSLGKFAHNSKYMFLELAETEEIGMDLVWISDDEEVVDTLSEKEFNAINSNTLRAKYKLLRAQYVFFDNYSPISLNSWLYLGSNKVNLWHGFPYKNITSDKESNGDLIEAVSSIYHRVFYKPDFFLETSKKYLGLYKKVFRTSEVVCAGYPRNDIFYEKIGDHELFSEKPPSEDYIVYMPTYRRYDENESIEGDINLDKIDAILERLDMKMVLKPHHRFDLSGDFSNIMISENNLDPYLLLKESEALISDYSSVVFDYMHTGKPIIRFEYDKEEYEKKRGLNDKIKHLVPGKQVNTVEELEEAMKNLEKVDTDYKDKKKEVFKYRKEGLQAEHILDQVRGS